MPPRKKKPASNGDVRRVPRACPRCGSVTDTTGPVADPTSKPVPGSVMVCLRCGMLEMFRESGQVSVLTAAEWIALDEEDRTHLLVLEDGRRRVMGG